MNQITDEPDDKPPGVTKEPEVPPSDYPDRDFEGGKDIKLRPGHPPAIWFFFWGELAERSSYYGMRAILFLYMTKALHLATTDAGPTYSAFKMACYFLPLVGGYIADRWLGRYWTIVGFSVPYVAGHFILGIPTEPAMIFALALLAGGSGVIKPNISTLMGQTYDKLRPGQHQLRSAAFLWFYFAINVGALLSQLLMPEIRERYILANLEPGVLAQAQAMLAEGKDITPIVPDDLLKSAYGIAFQFPAWLMVISLTIFAAGKRFYVDERPVHREQTPEELDLRWQELEVHCGFFAWLPYLLGLNASEFKSLVRLFGIFGLVVLFWFGYEHNDTLWIAFTSDYVDLQLPAMLGSKTIAPDQLQFLNALFVIILVPTFNILFGYLDPKVTIFTPMRKILAGFLLTAAAIGIMSVAGFLVEGHTAQVMQADKSVEIATVKVSVLWPAMAYIVLTFGEVLLYGTMLELAYAAAPKSMKGMVTACFLLTNTLGNFLNMAWTPLYGGALTDEAAKRGPLMPGPFFGITALVVIAAAIGFIFVGRQFERGQTDAGEIPPTDPGDMSPDSRRSDAIKPAPSSDVYKQE